MGRCHAVFECGDSRNGDILHRRRGPLGRFRWRRARAPTACCWTIVNPQVDPSIGDRLRLVQQAFQVGRENPVLGVGYGRGRLKEALRGNLPEGADQNPVAHTHNVYLELFAETGLLGLGIFLWLLCGYAAPALAQRIEPHRSGANDRFRYRSVLVRGDRDRTRRYSIFSP